MRLAIPFVLLLVNSPAIWSMDDDPLLASIIIDRFEIQEDSAQLIEAEFWVGRDMARWVVDVEMERERNVTHEVVYDLSYRRPVSPFWNIEAGVRQISTGSPDSTWLRLAMTGTLPYFIETEVAIVGKEGQAIIEAEFEHEMPLSSDWAIASMLELAVAAETDEKRGIGKGVVAAEASIQLRYEGFKNVHPYIGIQSLNYPGKSGEFLQEHGEETHRTGFVMGIHAWF